MTSDIIAIFPLPIYKTNIGREFTKQEQDELDVITSEQLKEADMKGTGGAKNISIDHYLLNRKIFSSFHSFILHHLKEFVTTVIGIDISKSTWFPHICQSWLNTFEPNHQDSFHAHRNCVISGVFYINCLEYSGDKPDGIVFAPTSHHMLEEFDLPPDIIEDTMFSDKPYHVPAVEGDLILFPSTAYHRVNLNETSDQTRISLAFNTFFFGVLGDYENVSELILKQEK